MKEKCVFFSKEINEMVLVEDALEKINGNNERIRKKA
jgi:hypothetical protein